MSVKEVMSERSCSIDIQVGDVNKTGATDNMVF